MTTSYGTGKVLIFSGVRGDTRRYRTLHLYEQLKLAGADCILSHLTDPRLPDLADQASVVILHRVAFDPYVEKLFSVFRRREALVILDADDFLYDPEIMRWIDSPDFQDPVRAALYRAEILRHRATLDHCDAVTVSTHYLASLMEPFGKPVRIHRNAFCLEMLAQSQRAFQNRAPASDRVVIGYASGTRTHDRDFAMIRPALRSVMERHPNALLWLMGPLDPGDGWGDLRSRVLRFDWVPWRALPARLAQVDINLVPLLPNSPFNQAKSEIKFMEAALVHVPSIASNTSTFTYAIEHGRNGFIAAQSEEWESLLDLLITDSTVRRAVGENAYSDVLARYEPVEQGYAMIRMLAEIGAQVGKDRSQLLSVSQIGSRDDVSRPASQFTPADEAHPTYLDLARYSIQHRGLKTLLGQVWVFIRRLFAGIFPFKGRQPEVQR